MKLRAICHGYIQSRPRVTKTCSIITDWRCKDDFVIEDRATWLLNSFFLPAGCHQTSGKLAITFRLSEKEFLHHMADSVTLPCRDQFVNDICLPLTFTNVSDDKMFRHLLSTTRLKVKRRLLIKRVGKR